MSVISEQSPLRLGDVAPNFTAHTTEGEINFYDYIGNSWCLLFSHAQDFTPVCTTELGEAARRKKEFDGRGVKMIALGVDSTRSHNDWISDINETQNTIVNFPIISDPERTIASIYGMIHPSADHAHTVRSLFIIDPSKKVRLIMSYPASTGRNFDEILRVVDALQLTDSSSVATPVNWRHGEECVIPPHLNDPVELNARFPKGWREVNPYLRFTPHP